MELVIDPVTIPQRFPNASLAHPIRLRIFAAVVTYDCNTISVAGIPSLTDNYCPVPIALTPANTKGTDIEIYHTGQLVELDGLYNGTTLQCFKINSIANRGFNDHEIIDTLKTLASGTMKSLNEHGF